MRRWTESHSENMIPTGLREEFFMSLTLRVPANKNDHFLGPLHAPVVLVEYGDYECPYSAVVAPVLERLIREYKSSLCLVFRHYPLKALHSHSEYAALAAEASDRQGNFWQMHKLLFQNYDSISSAKIDQLAIDLDLNMNLFHKDLERQELKAKVEYDYLTGVQSEVNATPSIFINDLRYEGSSSYWPLRESIEQHLRGGESAYF